MSTSRGSSTRKRPQKHQNRTAFKNDLHDTSHKTKFLNTLDVPGVCKRCKDIIDWKIKYKKYKPLTAPRKCVDCEQKTVKYAYHMLCTDCAKSNIVCAKCCKPITEGAVEEHIAPTPNNIGKGQEDDDDDDDAVEEPAGNKDIAAILKDLPERKRRTIKRYISKQEPETEITLEMLKKIYKMVADLDTQIDLAFE